MINNDFNCCLIKVASFLKMKKNVAEKDFFFYYTSMKLVERVSKC